MPIELTDEDRKAIANLRAENVRSEPYMPALEKDFAAEIGYRAGLAAGIERAAQVCETGVARPQDTIGERWAYDRCAAAIRALLK